MIQLFKSNPVYQTKFKGIHRCLFCRIESPTALVHTRAEVDCINLLLIRIRPEKNKLVQPELKSFGLDLDGNLNTKDLKIIQHAFHVPQIQETNLLLPITFRQSIYQPVLLVTIDVAVNFPYQIGMNFIVNCVKCCHIVLLLFSYVICLALN